MDFMFSFMDQFETQASTRLYGYTHIHLVYIKRSSAAVPLLSLKSCRPLCSVIPSESRIVDGCRLCFNNNGGGGGGFFKNFWGINIIKNIFFKKDGKRGGWGKRVN
jgi:hypothetical protein